ncbi:type II 3-dehydroquinate dehydratase [bacterium]|nr:type II 3-dehydroquinate dehydratase [bacterium]
MLFNKKPTILVLHGPNLNLLGEREPDTYGTMTLKEIDRMIAVEAKKLNVRVKSYQSNHEGRLVDKIQNQRKHICGILINPAAYTHSSIAIRDAISATGLPAVEVHLSDITKREDFRKHSFIADVCITQISGFGAQSYIKGLHFLAKKRK